MCNVNPLKGKSSRNHWHCVVVVLWLRCVCVAVWKQPYICDAVVVRHRPSMSILPAACCLYVPMHACVCFPMCVCVSEFVHVRVLTCLWFPMCVCASECVCVSKCVHARVFTCLWSPMGVCVSECAGMRFLCVRVCVRVFTCICVSECAWRSRVRVCLRFRVCVSC